MTIFHLSIGFEGSEVEATTIQDALTGQAGWARYSKNCWFVATDCGAKELADRVRAVCSGTDSIFVTEFHEENSYGFLSAEIWKWLSDPAAYRRPGQED